jgi:hypothetical protein
MAVSAVVSWAASRSAAVAAAGGDLGGVVVRTVGAAGRVVAVLVAVRSGTPGGANGRPAVARAGGRQQAYGHEADESVDTAILAVAHPLGPGAG